MQAQPSTENLFFRNDTMLGVCEAIGQDFGFHPNWLRLAFALVFLANPAIVAGVYVGLGVVVAVSRWAAPDQAVPAPQIAAAERAEPELALAA